MPSTRFHIDKPCRENWEAMSPTERGRHCAACSKEVIDFTRYSEQEMIDYFSSRKGEQVCGRMELKTDFPQFIIRPKNEYKPYGYWMTLSLAALLIAGCSQNNPEQAQSSLFAANVCVRLDTNMLKGSRLNDKSRMQEHVSVTESPQEIEKTKINDSTFLVSDTMMFSTGDIVLIDLDYKPFCTTPVYKNFENPDEGNAWLDKFIQAQAIYPRRERELGISGRVVVQFTLAADGSIKEPTIVESPYDAWGLELEAVRLTNLITGLEPQVDIYGKPAQATLSIPYLFELSY